MKEEKTADNENIAELMLIVAKELEEIANREEIKSKFYLEWAERQRDMILNPKKHFKI